MRFPDSILPGINGVRVLPPSKGNDTVFIYFSNTGAATFHLVPVSLSTLQKLGPVEPLLLDTLLMILRWMNRWKRCIWREEKRIHC